MSTFLIETSEEDTTTAVARLVAEYLDGGKVRASAGERRAALRPPPPGAGLSRGGEFEPRWRCRRAACARTSSSFVWR